MMGNATGRGVGKGSSLGGIMPWTVLSQLCSEEIGDIPMKYSIGSKYFALGEREGRVFGLCRERVGAIGFMDAGSEPESNSFGAARGGGGGGDSLFFPIPLA